MTLYGFLIHWGGEHADERPTAMMVQAKTGYEAWQIVLYQAFARGWPVLRIYKVRELVNWA